MNESSEWQIVVRDLIPIVALAREAHRDSCRPRKSVDGTQVRRCELEIAQYMRQAREYLSADQTTPEITAEKWREAVLGLLRSHSLVWEVNWLQYEGLPKNECREGMGAAGAEITRAIVACDHAPAGGEP